MKSLFKSFAILNLKLVSSSNFNVDELTISSNASWTIHSDGTFTNFTSILGTDGLLLAEAAIGISNSITASDVVLSGQGWAKYWMYGISELYTKTNNANGTTIKPEKDTERVIAFNSVKIKLLNDGRHP